MNTFYMAYLYLLMVVWVVFQVFWPPNTGWRREMGTFEVDYEIPHRGQVPSAHAIRTWIRNSGETGSDLIKKPSGGILSAFFPENIDAVQAAVHQSRSGQWKLLP
jgi:hypothetical protein